MAVNNCVKYLLFFFNLLFWVSPSCCLLLPVAAACSGSVGSDPQKSQGVASLRWSEPGGHRVAAEA